MSEQSGGGTYTVSLYSKFLHLDISFMPETHVFVQILNKDIINFCLFIHIFEKFSHHIGEHKMYVFVCHPIFWGVGTYYFKLL